MKRILIAVMIVLMAATWSMAGPFFFGGTSSSFDPSSPGTIGGTTPGVASFTTLNFTTWGTVPAALPNSTTATTQSAGDNSTKVATTAYVDSATAVLSTYTDYSNGTCTTAKTITPENGKHQSVTLTHAQTCALTFTQPAAQCTAAGQPYVCCTAASTGVNCRASILLKITQDTVSSYNGAISGGKWPGGTVPTITATSGAIDYIACDLDGTNANCVASQDFR